MMIQRLSILSAEQQHDLWQSEKAVDTFLEMNAIMMNDSISILPDMCCDRMCLGEVAGATWNVLAAGSEHSRQPRQLNF